VKYWEPSDPILIAAALSFPPPPKLLACNQDDCVLAHTVVVTRKQTTIADFKLRRIIRVSFIKHFLDRRFTGLGSFASEGDASHSGMLFGGWT
jgi:hypothetical protein